MPHHKKDSSINVDRSRKREHRNGEPTPPSPELELPKKPQPEESSVLQKRLFLANRRKRKAEKASANGLLNNPPVEWLSPEYLESLLGFSPLQ